MRPTHDALLKLWRELPLCRWSQGAKNFRARTTTEFFMAALGVPGDFHKHRGLASGMTEAKILADFPDLTALDLRACQAFAADHPHL